MDRPNRSAERCSLYEDLQVSYEGIAGEIAVHVPDLSSRGMFINTSEDFPEGSVLRVCFLLPRTKVYISARAEVRYCLPEEGVGVEFIHLEEDQRAAIEHELTARCCPYETCLHESSGEVSASAQ